MTLTINPNWWEEPLSFEEPGVRIIEDSRTEAGQRLTTVEMRINRFILAELNTHTIFSRNSASSRAIPVHKQIAMIKDGMAYPVAWPSEKPGMQGGEPLSDEDIEAAMALWMHAGLSAVTTAEQMVELGLHKSVTNRILEPFMYHTATVTSVDWGGFFAQRSLKHTAMAQPEFAVVATALEDLMLTSEPTLLKMGHWHTPYIRPEEREEFESWDLLRLSTARCARTSYLTHDGERDPEADFKLFDRLSEPEDGGFPHASPFQHVATPEPENERTLTIFPASYGIDAPERSYTVPILGNARGWMQLRHILLGV